MSELLPVTIVSLLLALASHEFSIRDYHTLSYRKKDFIFYFAMTLVMIAFVGLRTSYNDTYTYKQMYESISIGTDPFIEAGNWLAIGDNPGFNFINAILVNLGFSTQSFLMFYAACAVGIYLWFIRKYTTNIWFSIFLFFTVGCYTFTLAAIKQCMAVALALVGVDFALRKKWIPFIIFVFVASTIHPYALMFLVAPLMTYKPWSRRGVYVFIFFLILGSTLQRLLGTLVDITTMLGEEYDINSFSGEGINPFRLAVCAVPLVLSFIGRKVVWSESDKTTNLLINLALLNAEIMFVGLFGTANYFGRLANYFSIFQCLSIPWLMHIFEPHSKRVVTACAVIGYLLYFYYANVINQNFDAIHNGITIFQYLDTIF